MALRGYSSPLGRQTFDTGLDLKQAIAAEDTSRRAMRQDEGRDMYAWASLVPERGLPLNFEDFPYQRDWYSKEVAETREAVWMKAAQVGMSGYAWRWGARRAEQFGDRVIYFFPTDDDVTDFGDQRIEPSIEESEYLRRRIPANYVRNKHLKRIGHGDLSLRGTQSRAAVQSVDADALVFDEYNYLHQANLAQAERRLAGAQAAGRVPRVRRFGYPTIPGFGIHPLYERSDRRQWHVTCPACELEQTIDWGANMRWRTAKGEEERRWGDDDYDDPAQVYEAWRACRECDASLEGHPIRAGRWIRTQPDAELIGFHVPRLIVPRTDLIELVRNSRKTQPHEVEAFFQNDLGMPFIPAEAALSDADIDAACLLGREEQHLYRERNPLVAGFDVASERRLSGWVDELLPDGTARAVWIGEPHNFTDVVEIIRRYNPEMVVIDSMPERRSARAVAATFPGIVVLASYDDRNEADAFKYNLEKNLVTINRTEGLDAMMDGIRHRRRIPLKVPPRRFKSQLMSPKRVTELDSKQRPKRLYVSTGPDGDDYAHAGVYALVAKEMYALKIQTGATIAAGQGEPVADERLGWREEAYDRPARY